MAILTHSGDPAFKIYEAYDRMQASKSETCQRVPVGFELWQGEARFESRIPVRSLRRMPPAPGDPTPGRVKSEPPESGRHHSLDYRATSGKSACASGVGFPSLRFDFCCATERRESASPALKSGEVEN
jgi:hypothetical protein